MNFGGFDCADLACEPGAARAFSCRVGLVPSTDGSSDIAFLTPVGAQPAMAAVGVYGAVRETVIAHAFALVTKSTGSYGCGALL